MKGRLMFDGDAGQPGAALGGVQAAFLAVADAHSVSEAGTAVVQPQAALSPATAHVGIQPATVPPPLWTSADFKLTSQQQYVIKGLLASGNVGVILGQPGAGKSTLAPRIAYAVAQGYPLFGMRSRKGRTLYLAAEDAAGVKKRLYALGRNHGHTSDCAMLECGNLNEDVAQDAVWAAIIAFNPTLVILDTLAAAFAGVDENASAGMSQIVAWLRAVAATGAAVLAVHHPAKGEGGTATARGHGSFNGTLDMSLILKSDDVTDATALVRGTLAKNRNGSTARTLAFRKEVIVLGQDDEGDYITTTLPIEEAADFSKPTVQLPKQQAKALVLLQELLAKNNCSKVTETMWRNYCEDQKLSTSEHNKTRKEAFSTAYSKLLECGKIVVGEGMVWLPTVVVG